MTHALVVHSPLVGPATVRPLGAALERLGWSASCPDLRGGLASPATFCAVAVAEVPAADVAVAHSGSGAYLPFIADRTGARAMVFVDALLPHEESARFQTMLDRVVGPDGLLARWDEWWPPEVMRALVPDDRLRDELVAEIPRVPRSFYDHVVAVPDDWRHACAAYLRLSPAYDEQRAQAEALGWPWRAVDGGHLDVAVRPELVAGHVTELVAALPTVTP